MYNVTNFRQFFSYIRLRDKTRVVQEAAILRNFTRVFPQSHRKKLVWQVLLSSKAYKMPSKDPLPSKENALFKKILVNIPVL